jgi:hypothetical protein
VEAFGQSDNLLFDLNYPLQQLTVEVLAAFFVPSPYLLLLGQSI